MRQLLSHPLRPQAVLPEMTLWLLAFTRRYIRQSYGSAGYRGDWL